MLVVIGVFQDSVAADNAEPDDAASAESTKKQSEGWDCSQPSLVFARFCRNLGGLT